MPSVFFDKSGARWQRKAPRDSKGQNESGGIPRRLGRLLKKYPARVDKSRTHAPDPRTDTKKHQPTRKSFVRLVSCVFVDRFWELKEQGRETSEHCVTGDSGLPGRFSSQEINSCSFLGNINRGHRFQCFEIDHLDSSGFGTYAFDRYECITIIR